MKTIFEIFSASSGFIAAFFWFKSARIKIPNSSAHLVVSSISIPTDDDLPDALRKQSKLSAIAAIFAGVSIIFQSITLILEYYKFACPI